MKRILLLPLLAFLFCSAPAGAEQGERTATITLQAKKSKKDKADDDSAKPEKKGRPEKEVVRDPRKAAAAKKKEMREKGIKTVRVSGPSDWPKRIPVPKDITLQKIGESADPQQPGFCYASNHYEFNSQVELTEAGQNMIGRLFECTYAANQAISKVVPVPRCDVPRVEKLRYRVRLVKNQAEYAAQGGPDGSAGVFKHATRVDPTTGKPFPIKQESDIATDFVLVPLNALGLDEKARMVKPDIDTHTLVHEATHQNFVMNNMPIWANEGWAEYVGYVPYMGEELDFDRLFSQIVYKAQQNADALNCPFTLHDLMVMSQEDMYGYMGSRQADTYTVSVMTIAFFVHLDGKRGLEAIKAYMSALIEGTPNEDAVAELEKAYGGAEKLQKAFVQAWKRKKVTISFAK